MKLIDLIKALADEVNIMRPQLEEIVDSLISVSPEESGFIEILDSYNDYVLRLGEASEMVGFIGIKFLCEKIEENILIFPFANEEEQGQLGIFLKAWPDFLSDFLNQLDENFLSVLLACFAAAPIPFTDAKNAEVEQLLLDIMKQANDGVLFEDEENIRQIEAQEDDISLELPSDLDQSVMDGFLQESPDMANDLVIWAKQVVSGLPIIVEDVQRAKRYTHTLKGTGATIGARGLASVGHHLEDILEYLEDNLDQANNYLNNLLLDAAYCMEQMVLYIAGVDEEPEQSLFILQQLLDVANKIDSGESLSSLDNNSALPHAPILFEKNETANRIDNNDKSDVATPTKQKKQSKSKDKVSTLRISVKKIDDLFRMSGEISIHSSAMEDRIKLLTEQSQQLLDQNLRVQKRLFELETLVDVRALNVIQARTSDVEKLTDGFDPLEMDQYNELHSSAHALVEEAADTRMFTNIITEQIASLGSMQTRQQMLSRDLQHLVISTRMSEVGELESRLQRNIRTTSQMTGKSVNLEMTGQDTLIDSDLISKLADPLLHLLRNAVDHGVETPEEREVAGKLGTGNIYLDFFRQGQQVVLRCEDDGRGLNLEKIRNRALEHGLISDQQILTNEEVAQLIFRSGFSSRDSVSEISGRGVGLDVVRDWASQMNGSVHIETGKRGGCLFELRFAASLSTIQSLIVSTDDDSYFAIPAVQIEQAVANNVGKFDYLNGKFTYFYDNEYISAHFLSSLVGLVVDTEKDLSSYNAVIVTIDGKRYALAVSKLLDSRELLVTPPGRFAKHLDGVSGLSILGNGSIAVNLDLSQLLSVATLDTNVKHEMVKTKKTTKKIPKILIVDDALTVRNALQQFVQDIGFQAYTARDGFEAVNILKTVTPTVILTDMEMPNMNGIDLTKHIRSKESLKHLPVIMITSRSQAKHRELANNAGVSDYITKPYSDATLLSSIKQFF